MTTKATPARVERHARLKWVPIEQMAVSPLAQRDINQARVDRIAADLDIEQLGSFTVNQRDGHYYVIDGNHRRMALIQHGWGDQQVQCWTYEGLTEEQEAEIFLKLNDVLAVDALARFRVGIVAGREKECDIGLVGAAEKIRLATGNAKGQCVAAAAVEIINRGKGGRKLPSWWKD